MPYHRPLLASELPEPRLGRSRALDGLLEAFPSHPFRPPIPSVWEGLVRSYVRTVDFLKLSRSSFVLSFVGKRHGTCYLAADNAWYTSCYESRGPEGMDLAIAGMAWIYRGAIVKGCSVYPRGGWKGFLKRRKAGR